VGPQEGQAGHRPLPRAVEGRCPREIATWEEESCIHDEFINGYEAALEAEQEVDTADAAEDASSDDESGAE